MDDLKALIYYAVLFGGALLIGLYLLKASRESDKAHHV